jgi:pyrroloquinoline quinone (PQQ) biosynthesis protein C
MHNPQIEKLNAAIQPYRNQLLQHPVYQSLQNLSHVQAFMQVHVHAVWDFMVLLKSLQRNLTNTNFIWHPVGTANTRFLINEIVLGEESDVHPDGGHISHFELYLQAMQKAGADSSHITLLINNLINSSNFMDTIKELVPSTNIAQFNTFTLNLVQNHPVHVQAAVFTFGREDLIPDMFHHLVNNISQQYPSELSLFKYYLERHIEIDGDHHSHLALEMTATLCGDDDKKWEEATQASIEALQMRYLLWNAVLENITETA